jgi:hypothetical protein
MEQIWFVDIRGFMNEHNFLTFFPSSEMTFAEQLNALLRFTIYLSLIVMLVKKDTSILFAPILMAILTYLVYTVDQQKKMNDKHVLEQMQLREDRKTKQVCQAPSENNPFMNVLISDYSANPQRPKACRLEGKTKRDATKYFERNLYRDVDDVFQKNASDRQWYTTPSTTIPNDAIHFANWLYKTPPTCKEGNGMTCYKNTYTSYAR